MFRSLNINIISISFEIAVQQSNYVYDNFNDATITATLIANKQIFHIRFGRF